MSEEQEKVVQHNLVRTNAGGLLGAGAGALEGAGACRGCGGGFKQSSTWLEREN